MTWRGAGRECTRVEGNVTMAGSLPLASRRGAGAGTVMTGDGWCRAGRGDMVAADASAQITELKVGDHACLTFGEAEELFDLTAAYVRDGLAGGSKVMWLGDDGQGPTVAELARRGIAVRPAMTAASQRSPAQEASPRACRAARCPAASGQRRHEGADRSGADGHVREIERGRVTSDMNPVHHRAPAGSR